MREKKHLKTASRLRECLDSENMKAIELAERIGVNRSAITHYLNGTSCPKNDTAMKIANVFGVNPAWLMELSDEKYSVDYLATIDTDEQILIESYKNATQERRRIVLDILGISSDEDEKGAKTWDY